MPVQPRKAMCSRAWADPGKPAGVSSPPTLKFSSTVTTGASALRTTITCKPLERVARVTLLGSAAWTRGANAVSRKSTDNRALSFNSISPGEFSQVVSSLSWLGYARLPGRSLQWHNIHADFQAVFGAPQQNTTNRADVAVITAPGQGDVAVGGDAVIGGVEVYPAKPGAPRRTPGMGSVGADQAWTARRRNGPQISADVTRRKAKRAHAGDLQMRKVLAHSAALFEEGGDGRSHFGCLGIEAEILVDARGQV